jgi:predicted TIM-barrel fold metal-dependent hydrolase
VLTDAAKLDIRELTAYLQSRQNSIVIDADVHGTDLATCERKPGGYYHGRPLSLEELVREMDQAGVDMANVWQNPAATIYPGSEEANTEALLAANRYLAHGSKQFPGRFIPSGWVDPRACGMEGAKYISRICVEEFGFAIVKMNPAQNRFPMGSPEVLAIVEYIAGLGAVPAFHYGADTPFTPPEGLETVARHLGDWPVIAVHMGGGGAGYLEAEHQYHASIALGLRYPNVKYIFSALRDTYIEEAVRVYSEAGEPFISNLFCASDAPYGKMRWNFGGFRELLKDHPKRENLMGGNFARFVLAAYSQLVKVNA